MSKELVINNKKLMEEWDYEKNSALGFFPDKLTCGSSKSVWWKCSICGNEWTTKISHRNNGSKCKKCNHIKLATAPKDKSLQTLYPQIAKEWNYKKNGITPDCVYPLSNKKYWWVCNKGHEWLDSPSHRVGRNSKCPICQNHQILVGYNDLATTHPKLIEEWDWERNTKKPTEITYGSNEPINWICKRGHRWKAHVYPRATKNVGCPHCTKEIRTSYPEKIIAYYLKKIFPDLIENYRNAVLGKFELDMFIPSINIAIEYDGGKWHQDNSKDLIKDELCEKAKINLIRIREYNCPDYKSSSKKTYLKNKDKHFNELEEILRDLLLALGKQIKKTIDIDINIDRDSADILQNVITKEKGNSIANTPLINEWNWDKNKGINPETIPKYSNRKFWWKCNKGHEWRADALHRSGGRNCPYCSGQKVLSGYNDLDSQYTEIAKEWDYSKNDKKPNEVGRKSNKKYWWICSKCGHSWETSVYVRTIMRCGCPECKKKKLSLNASRKVRNIEKGIVFESIKKASEELNINQSAISNCCRGISNTAGGYHWEYMDKKD